MGNRFGIHFLHDIRKYFARAMGSSPDSAFDRGILPLVRGSN
jgi:hypothetical protein